MCVLLVVRGPRPFVWVRIATSGEHETQRGTGELEYEIRNHCCVIRDARNLERLGKGRMVTRLRRLDAQRTRR